MHTREQLIEMATSAHDRWIQLAMALTDHVPNFERQRLIEATKHMTSVVKDVMKTMREEQA